MGLNQKKFFCLKNAAIEQHDKQISITKAYHRQGMLPVAGRFLWFFVKTVAILKPFG